MRVVVTGAGGYVGGRLVQHLVAAGEDVVPVVRRSTPWLVGAETVDLLRDELTSLLAGADAVVHLAGANERRFDDEATADAVFADTVTATERVASAAEEAGVPRLVFLSTFHVYAASRHAGVIDETVEPAPVDRYGRSRLVGEQLAAEHGPAHTVSLRLTNGVGPPAHPDVDRKTLAGHVFSRMAVTDGVIAMRDDGAGRRDFVDMTEVCRVVTAAAAGALPRGTYDLGSGVTRSIRDLAELVADAAEDVLGRRPEIRPGPPGPGGPPTPFRLDTSRLAAHVTPPDPDLHAALAATIDLLSRDGGGAGQP